MARAYLPAAPPAGQPSLPDTALSALHSAFSRWVTVLEPSDPALTKPLVKAKNQLDRLTTASRHPSSPVSRLLLKQRKLEKSVAEDKSEPFVPLASAPDRGHLTELSSGYEVVTQFPQVLIVQETPSCSENSKKFLGNNKLKKSILKKGASSVVDSKSPLNKESTGWQLSKEEKRPSPIFQQLLSDLAKQFPDVEISAYNPESRTAGSGSNHRRPDDLYSSFGRVIAFCFLARH